jgi:Tfp pilus assembly protein PilO
MTNQMFGLLYTAISSIVFVIILVVVVVQGFGAYRAKMSLTREDAYRKLAEEAVANTRKLNEEHQKTAAILEEMRTRLAAIEKILRDVE